MIVSINQPAYLPWLGYFHRIKISDVHVILDHVQFEKNSFTNRNKIRTKEGSTLLTVPLKTKGLFGNLAINTIETSDTIWRGKHLKTIYGAYSRAKYFERYEEKLKALFAIDSSKFIDFIFPLTQWMLDEAGITTKLIRSSELNCEGSKSDLVLEICKAVNANSYLSGPFGRNYLDFNSFKNQGIEVKFHDYQHPVYPQVFPGFEPYMAFLDLLVNHGGESINYLISGNEKSL